MAYKAMLEFSNKTWCVCVCVWTVGEEYLENLGGLGEEHATSKAA